MNKNLRKSNFEILRIIAMLMIVVHHITIHCFKVQLEDKSLYALGESFNQICFFKKLLLPQLFMATGKIGNIIFILITGYFLIDRKINITKQIKKIISQLVFVVPIVVVGSIFYYKFHSHNFLGIINFDIFNFDYWFIGYYLGIIAIAYVFLNKYLNRLDKNEYLVFLAIMFSVISIAFLRNAISGISPNLLSLITGIFIYSLGGFIRLYNPFNNLRTIILFLAIFLSILGICINNYTNTVVNINEAIRNNAQGMYQSLNSYGEYSIFCLLIGVALFEIFRRIKMNNISFINYISSSTFMIYLIHDNAFVRNIWLEKNWIDICYYSFGKFIVWYLVWVCIIFASGILIYTLYCLLLKIMKFKALLKIIFNTINKESNRKYLNEGTST